MIFVAAGTSEGKDIVELLLSRNKSVIASVTTGFAQSLFKKNNRLKIITKKMTTEDFTELIETEKVELIIDSTHPFAVEVSQNLIGAAEKTGCRYVRFERKTFDYKEKYKNVIEVDSFEAAALEVNKIEGNVFCTIGSKELHKVTEEVNKSRVFARVLPLSEMVKKCEEIGLTAGNIIAMKGPFSFELNTAMLKAVNAGVLLTKESGETGGFEEKLEAALGLDIPVVVVRRKKINYPEVVNEIENLINFIED